jgi:prevent-host-death family protein
MSEGEQIFGRIVRARDLSRRTKDVLDEVVATGEGKIIVRSGHMVARLQPINEAMLLDELLEDASGFTAQRAQGLRDIDGGRVFTVEEVKARRGGAAAQAAG